MPWQDIELHLQRLELVLTLVREPEKQHALCRAAWVEILHLVLLSSFLRERWGNARVPQSLASMQQAMRHSCLTPLN
jgi:hypothetical protein